MRWPRQRQEPSSESAIDQLCAAGAHRYADNTVAHVLHWLIIVVALQQAGFMAFDGTRALIVGDYVTPKTGEHAGQLGPWKHVIRAVGIEPRSTLMKSIFAVYGFMWLIIIVCFIFKLHWSWAAMLIAAIGALWYLPFGTLSSVIQIVLLCLPIVRRQFA
jgi:hypothetical protein